MILAGCLYGGRSRPAFVALVVGVALVGAVFLQNDASGAVQRPTRTSTSARSDIWTIGLRMVRANPVIGVDSGNHTIVEPRYLLTSSGQILRGDLIVTTPLPAHNVYLHTLAEMGSSGFALFLSILWLSVRSAVRGVAAFRATGQRSMELLGRALVVALAGILVADLFVSDQYSKQLGLLLAMGAALLAIARRPPEAAKVLRPVTPR